MKAISSVLVLALMSQAAFAEDSYKDLKGELNQEIQDLYPDKPTVRVKKTEIVEATAEPAAPPVVQQAPTKVEVNQVQVVESRNDNANTAAAVQAAPIIEKPESAPTLRVQDQPMTLVESSPVEASPADKLRKDRMNFEQETENKLVEKLEEERLNDEQKRREAIMNKLNGEPKEEPKAEPVVETVTPAPVYQEPLPVIESSLPPVQEVAAEAPKQEEEQVGRTQFFIGVQGGFGTFTEVDNIENGGVLGAMIGLKFPNNFLAEFGYTHVSYDIERDDSPFLGEVTNMEENAFSLGVKYQFLQETIRPYGGLFMSYRTRTYYDEQYYYYSSEEIETEGVDFGLEGGMDFALSEHFSIGAGFKYFINLYNDVKSDGPYDNQYSDFVGAEDTEDLNFWHFGMNAKAYF